MNPFDVLSGISTIQNVIDHVQNAVDGDLWGLAGLGADGVGVTQGVISLESLAAEAAETPVIEAGLWAIIAFNWMCGFGEPEKGDRFGEGGSHFNEIIEKLESAAAGASWTGSASDAYAGQNVKQQDRAKTMVDADFDMNQIISCEANQLNGTRDILDHAGTVLAYAIVPALAALRIPVIGPEISMGIQLGAVGGTVPVCQVEMINMATNALRNAQSIEKALDLYNSANPDPATRTMEVGLWGAPRSGTVEQSTDDSSDNPPSSPTPNAPSIPTPTAPPSTPPVPTPSAPSVGGSSPDNGSATLPSTPPVPQAFRCRPHRATDRPESPAAARHRRQALARWAYRVHCLARRGSRPAGSPQHSRRLQSRMLRHDRAFRKTLQCKRINSKQRREPAMVSLHPYPARRKTTAIHRARQHRPPEQGITMSGELRVTTEHLRKLSAKQSAAAAQIAAAATVADGVGSSMWVNHGLICAPTNIAVSNAELARTNACAGMESTSIGLAEKVNIAATQYDQTDAQAGDKIDDKMRPR